MPSHQSGKGVSSIYNIFGGVGRLVYAPTTQSYPTVITDVLSDPANGTLASGWTDFGATDGGVTITPAYEKEEWEVDQVLSPIDTFITRWTVTLETTLVEASLENLQVAWEGSSITEDTIESPDERTIKFGAPESMTKRMLAYIQDKRQTSGGDGRIRVYVFRRAQYNGSGSSHEFAKGQPTKVPITFDCLPDTDITAVKERTFYIIDQKNEDA